MAKLIPKILYFRLFFALNFLNIIRAKNYKLNSLKPFITNSPIKEKGYVLSNYGVWLLENFKDKTFNLAILGYRNNLEYILSSIEEPFTFFDIGCNQGVFSLVANKNYYCKKIHCFEPNTDLVPYLSSNLTFGGVKNFQIHNYAIWSTIGNIEFFVPINHSGASTFFNNENNFNRVFKSINRSYLDEIETDTENVIFLKLDVEGAEHTILTEIFSSKLSKFIKYVFVEINSTFDHSLKIRDFLFKNNFLEVSRKGKLNSCDAFFVKN